MKKWGDSDGSNSFSFFPAFLSKYSRGSRSNRQLKKSGIQWGFRWIDSERISRKHGGIFGVVLKIKNFS